MLLILQPGRRTVRPPAMAAWLAFLLALTGAAGEGSAPPSVLVIEGGTLIDGTGSSPLSDSVIVIEGDRIRDAGRRGEIDYPSHGRRVDARGKYILPGLIDGHVHYKDWSAELFLTHGVTTVVDLGNPTEWILAQREGIAKKKIFGPRILTSGNSIHGPYREGQFRRLHHTEVGSAEEARRVTRNLIAQGVDAIKVRENLTAGMLAAVLEEAQRGGLPVLGHTANAWEAIEAGYHAIVHTPGLARATIGDAEDLARVREGTDPHFFIDFQQADRLIEELVARGIHVNPTLRAHHSWAYKERFQAEDYELLMNNLDLGYVPLDFRLGLLNKFNLVGLHRFQDLSPEEQALNRKAVHDVDELLRRFVRAGGKLITGADSNNTPGLGVHQELQILVEDLGMSPFEAILTATRHPAVFFRVERDLGSIEAGKIADLVILGKNPLEDIRNSRTVEMVFKEGERVRTGYHPEHENPLPKHLPEDTGLMFPSPVVERLSPVIVTEGDREVTLTVHGTGFIPYSLIVFNGTRVETEFVNRFELRAKIPDALIERAGTLPVVVTNPRPVGTVFAPGQSHLQHFGLRGDSSNQVFLLVQFR